MSNNIRSQCKDALLALLTPVVFPDEVNGSTTWASPPSRRLKMFNAIDPSAQPALFIVQHREFYDAKGFGIPPKRYLEVGLWCFAPTGGDDIVGDELLDSMEEGIETIMNKPDDLMRNELTLGGLCYYAKIDRESNLFIRDPGDIDGQALLILPVRILLP